jgi:hypothetical protein
MEKYTELKGLIESLDNDVNKFYNKDVKAAAVRIRKGLQDIKKVAQEMRAEVSDRKNNM